MANNKRIFIETYGCQMNVYDSEIVLSILEKEGFVPCSKLEDADLILVNTCSIRENAEQRIWGRLDRFMQEKKHRKATVGVLGCMAERLKQELLSHPAVDLVAGPDTYRELPQMLRNLEREGDKQINTTLSLKETYADIEPVRTDTGGVTTSYQS